MKMKSIVTFALAGIGIIFTAGIYDAAATAAQALEFDKPLNELTARDVRDAVEAELGDSRTSMSSEDVEARVAEVIDQVVADLRKPEEPPYRDWSFEGPFGTFDRAALQRGYQVYREICSSCHSMKYLAFRNLSDEGGPEFSPEAVKALAAEFTVVDGPDEFGDMYDRPGKPFDHFPAPYENDNQGRAANGGALPPDLSLIVKAREHGPDYIYALLTGYGHDVPPLFKAQEGLNYNPYFPGRQLAMPQQLFDGVIEYTDGTEATAGQLAYDVVQFLSWAAEPKMEDRKALAKPVLIYLLILIVLLYASYKRIWRDVEH